MKMYGILMMMLLMSTAFAATEPVTIGDPTSPMYGIGLMFEGFHEEIVGVAFGVDAKLALQAKHHQFRITEMATMAYEGNVDGLNKAKQAMEQIETKMRMNVNKEATKERTRMLNGVLDVRTEVLMDLLSKVPEEAKKGIQTALDAPSLKYSEDEISSLPDGEVSEHLVETTESGGWMKDKLSGLKPGRVK